MLCCLVPSFRSYNIKVRPNLEPLGKNGEWMSLDTSPVKILEKKNDAVMTLCPAATYKFYTHIWIFMLKRCNLTNLTTVFLLMKTNRWNIWVFHVKRLGFDVFVFLIGSIHLSEWFSSTLDIGSEDSWDELHKASFTERFVALRSATVRYQKALRSAL